LLGYNGADVASGFAPVQNRWSGLVAGVFLLTWQKLMSPEATPALHG